MRVHKYTRQMALEKGVASCGGVNTTFNIIQVSNSCQLASFNRSVGNGEKLKEKLLSGQEHHHG